MLRSNLAGLAPLARARVRQAPIRASQAQTAGRRHFHFEQVIASTAEALSSLHALGVPWYYVIPLVAAGVNFSIRLPIHIYVSVIARRRRQLAPLVYAWTVRHSRDQFHAHNSARHATSLAKKSRKRIYKTWGVQSWKLFLPLLSTGPFLVVTQALRGLCGTPTLAFLDAESARGLVDRSMTDGGCLWFVDLAAQDPYYCLPLLCSVLAALNTWTKFSIQDIRELFTLNDTRPKTPMQRAKLSLTRLTLFFPMVAIFYAYLPSAIFLYWATTFGLGSINAALSNWCAPLMDIRTKLVMPQKTPRFHPNLPFLRGPHSTPKPSHSHQQ
ncbi:mitochondrial export translocase Oxa2 [Ophiocordyceps camponoti-floridani]|uniref:Mitochondrial export translocase Oxa2 n=1 Tax=Ophiocordyceps camponoti-floridani TaxID=2030778 RepID=A0A8H4Q218_9HYPO|nr:mitochondrial export translocase Oxa2 [Ophiocordyceps camponoti-floridani]